MAKGICGLEPCSLGVGDVCVSVFSPPKKLALPGIVEVGEGSTSVNREGGSLRSAFQIPVPQGKDGGP